MEGKGEGATAADEERRVAAEYDAILVAEEALRREQQQHPLIGPRLSFADAPLLRQVAGSATFEKKVARLAERYAAVRHIRRDGSCFLRAASFRLLELTLGNADAARALARRLQTFKAPLERLYGDFALDFLGVVEAIVADIAKGIVKAPEELLAALTGEESEYVVCCFRYITALWMIEHAEVFSVVVEALAGFPITVEEFCNAEVIAVGKESDQPHIVAFCQALQAEVTIEYVDNSATETATRHQFGPADGDATIVGTGGTCALLYRPGHYDLLY